MEVVPLDVTGAAEAIGSAVLTADAVPLGHLVAAREEADGRLFCIVRLDDALEATTSALIVEGLGRAPDGSLRLPEPAAALAARMRLPLGDG